ncbi:hypothetical protein GGI24_004200, partial [Coemansia furcata]
QYIAVLPPPTHEPAQIVDLDDDSMQCIRNLRQTIADDISTVPSDPNNSPNWVKLLRWDKIHAIAGFEEFAGSLHDIGQDDDMHNALRRITAQVMGHVNSFIRGASLYFLRGIGNNTPNASEDIFRNLWREIKEGTLYSNTMALFVYAVLKAADSDQLSMILGLFDFQIQSARQLKRHLLPIASAISNDGNIGAETKQRFWELAIDLFAYSIKERHGNPINHPIYVFVSLLAFEQGMFSYANAHRDYVCRLIYWGRAAICLAMHNVKDHIVQRLPNGMDDVGNSTAPVSHEQFLDQFALQNRRSDAYIDLDLTIYSAGFQHLQPQSSVSLVVGLADLAKASLDSDGELYNADIANDDKLWRGLHHLLEDNRPTPMGALFAMGGILSRAGEGYTKPPSVVWVPNSNYSQLVYDADHTVHISDLSHAYAKALRNIREILAELLKPIESTTLPLLSQLKDDCNDMVAGASFLNNPLNNLAQHKEMLFNVHIESHYFYQPGYPWNFRVANMRLWQRLVLLLINYFLFAMHLTGGQPAWAPELNLLLVENWGYQLHGIYVIHGHIAMAI